MGREYCIRKSLRIWGLTGLAILCLAPLSGCAGFLPVPGGSETTNKNFYKTDEDFLAAMDRLMPGMREQDVFEITKRKKEDLTKLDRADIIKALYGGSDVELLQGTRQENMKNHHLQSLYGYKFTYKIVEREHGFTSPIRIRTDESGYSYTVNLIFREGLLFEKPVISGGVVNNTSSSTIFDYLTPSTVIEHSVK